MCKTKEITGKGKKQSCSNRNATYETWCGTCEDREREKLESEETQNIERGKNSKDKGKKGKGNNKVRLHKYIGETGRSVYERGKEHNSDREKWDKGSHMLKHIVKEHEGEEEQKIQFRMKILRTHMSPFERQVYEGIKIQRERTEHDILNSKTEYNRCALPRLVVKVGEGRDKGRDKQKREEERKETEVEQKIVELKNQNEKIKGEVKT